MHVKSISSFLKILAEISSTEMPNLEEFLLLFLEKVDVSTQLVWAWTVFYSSVVSFWNSSFPYALKHVAFHMKVRKLDCILKDTDCEKQRVALKNAIKIERLDALSAKTK